MGKVQAPLYARLRVRDRSHFASPLPLGTKNFPLSTICPDLSVAESGHPRVVILVKREPLLGGTNCNQFCAACLAMALSANAKDAPNLEASQKNVSPKAQLSRQTNKQQVRHRASVACASCRDRRIRCVVPKNQNECVACAKSGAECIIKNDDERRRYAPKLPGHAVGSI